MANLATGRPHPVIPELVGGLSLTANAFEKENGQGTLVQLLSNAEYWLSFELASFEPLLVKSPSPLRELGVGISLKYSEHMFGEITTHEIEKAREQLLPKLDDEALRVGIEGGLDVLARAVASRDRIQEAVADGFAEYSCNEGLSVHALRSNGRSKIFVKGQPDDPKILSVPLGERIIVSATDERGRPLAAPDVESRVSAPLLSRDGEDGDRTVIFFIPGEYHLRVQGRATGDRKLRVS